MNQNLKPMKTIWQRYWKPSTFAARVIGDISLLLAMLATYIDSIIPVIEQYTFGNFIEKNKGVVLIVLISIKFVSNFTAKRNDSEGKN